MTCGIISNNCSLLKKKVLTIILNQVLFGLCYTNREIGVAASTLDLCKLLVGGIEQHEMVMIW